MERDVTIMKIWMAMFLDDFVVHSMDFLMKHDIAVENMADNIVVHEKKAVNTQFTNTFSDTICIFKLLIQAFLFFFFFYL